MCIVAVRPTIAKLNCKWIFLDDVLTQRKVPKEIKAQFDSEYTIIVNEF